MMNIAQPPAGARARFGKYFLLEKLATGGMGEVFLARQEGPAGFEKILVVKKILGHLTENKEFVELFLGEARLAARMNHRNIVQVFELGEHEGTYYIAMEYVLGKSLREVIDAAQKRRERIPPEIARSIAEQICDGASYAHNLTDITGRSLNIIHRDLNPQNVLLSFGGDVKVIDFGIAKSEISTVKTEAGMIKGKFVYMSPEQSLAKPLDKRSDVFAIGITLYEMLCGQNPFQKSNVVHTLEAIQRSEPLPASECDPALAPFDPILAKALAKDPGGRYADPSEMQEDLRRIVLPRAPERLSAFLARLFRPGQGGEQKPVRDSDSWKITGSRSPSTPPSRTALEAAAAISPTLLVSTPPASQPVARGTSSRPWPKPPPPPPKRPASPSTGTGTPPPVMSQESSAHEAAPAPIATEIAAAPTVEPVLAVPAAPAPVAAAAPPRAGPVTDRIRKGPLRRPRWSARALWIAFGGGVFLAVLAIAALVVSGSVDDRPAPRLRRTLLAGVARAEKATQASTASGTLWLEARGATVRFDGAAMPKQSGSYQFPVTSDAGNLDVSGAQGTPAAHLTFVRIAGALELRIAGSPGSSVLVNGAAADPAQSVKLDARETLVELRKNGEQAGLALKVQYREP
jgi:serine/threonine protein kinase